MEKFQFQFHREMRIKDLHKKNLVKDKRINVDSIKDHLIPQVSSLNTPKEMFDSLTKLFEGKNINRNMTLGRQLKNVKIQNAESKNKFEVVKEEVKNAEVVIATLNGLPRSWDSLIQGMCSRRKCLLSVDSGKSTHKKKKLDS